MTTRTIKLQIFYILLAIFNFAYSAIPFWLVRKLLLKLTGSKIEKDSCIQKCKFFTFGKLKVGKKSVINSGCYLDCRRGITIGDYVVIAHDTKIYTLGHDYNNSTFITKGSPVIVEDFVIIFSNVLIMPGVKIKKGAVVLPGSVITKDVEEMQVVGGNPARFIKYRDGLHYNKQTFNYTFSI